MENAPISDQNLKKITFELTVMLPCQQLINYNAQQISLDYLHIEMGNITSTTISDQNVKKINMQIDSYVALSATNQL